MISAFRLVKRFDRRKGIKENSGEKNVIFILRLIWIGNLKEGTWSYETMAVKTWHFSSLPCLPPITLLPHLRLPGSTRSTRLLSKFWQLPPPSSRPTLLPPNDL